MWVFKVRKKPEYLEKKTQKIWRQRLILGHIGERRLLSPLPQACPPTTPPPLRQRKLYFINRGQLVKKNNGSNSCTILKSFILPFTKEKASKTNF